MWQPYRASTYIYRHGRPRQSSYCRVRDDLATWWWLTIHPCNAYTNNSNANDNSSHDNDNTVIVMIIIHYYYFCYYMLLLSLKYYCHTLPTLASYDIAVSVFVVGQSEDVDVQHGAINLLVTKKDGLNTHVYNTSIIHPLQIYIYIIYIYISYIIHT